MSSSYGSCCYIKCTNSYSTNSNSAFFNFPNDEARRKKWLANCGNPEIAQLSDRHLRGKRICALHFTDKSFTDSSKKDALTDKAIPLKFKKAKSPEPEEITPAKKPRCRAAAAGKTPEPVVTQTPVKPRRGSEASSTEATTNKSEKQKQAPASTKEKQTVVNEAKADTKSSAPQLRGKSTRRISEASTETTNKAEKQQKSMPVLVKETSIIEAKSDEKSSSPQLRGKSRRGSETAAAVTTTEKTNKAVKPKSAPTLVNETTIHEAKAKIDNVRAGSTSPQRKAIEERHGSQVLETPAGAAAPTACAIIKTEAVSEFKDEEHKACIIPHVHSKFGKVLHSFLNDLLNEEEPSIKKKRKSKIDVSRRSESLNNSSSIGMKVAASRQSRVPFEQPVPKKVVQKVVKKPGPGLVKPSIKVMQLQKLNQQAQRANNIGHQGQADATPAPEAQYVTYDAESGNLVIQNNDGSGGVGAVGEFTLEEGVEYEVIGEYGTVDTHQHHLYQLNRGGGGGHGHDHHSIQVVDANENNNDTIEIIEVDDQTMAQLTGQCNIQLVELFEIDPNWDHIIQVINQSEEEERSYDR